MRNVAYLAGIVLAIAAASHFAFELSRAGTSAFFLVMAVPTVALAALGVLRARHDGILKSWVSVKSGDFSRGFAAAVVLFGAAYAFTKTVAPPESIRASWLARLYLQLGDPTVLRKSVGAVVVAIIVMAIAEELLWRGLVVSLLEEQIGSRRAWVWAAVLYAVAHAPTIWALRDPVAGLNPVIVLAALGCGLVWGGMARAFGRLLPGVFSHVLFDWTVIMMFRLWGPSI
ncbi:MAG: CPBP family intramembrane metalloprotease [Labilithrix sp.]|nr:CPBP family intramembrane metalloprotease [Labilithrix sp.]